MSITVTFFNVGHEKKTWVSTLPELSHDQLYRAVKASGELMSSHIDFSVDDDARTGVVLVGGWRPVGEFMWEAQ